MKIPKINLDINMLWHRWRANLSRLSAHILIAIWLLASMGIHVLGELPEKIRYAILGLLLATIIELLFKIYFWVKNVRPEISYKNIQETIPAMLERIQDMSQNSSQAVSIQFVGVAMFQGFEFITQNLRDLVGKNPSMKVDVEICMNSMEFLKTFEFDNTIVNWPELASIHLQGLKSMMTDKRLTCGGRLKIKGIYIYENLPHWHGILIGHNDLFLSRSNWASGSFEETSVKPIFTAGINKYRHYFMHDHREGSDRIAAFGDWFQFYKRIAIEKYESPTVSNQSGTANG